MTFVLDTSAVLAALWEEPGGEGVSRVIEGALISTVNLSEIVAKLVERDASDEQAARTIAALPLDVRGFDTDDAVIAGLLRRETRGIGLSFGDRACLALGIREGATILTADKAWATLDLSVEIELIR